MLGEGPLGAREGGEQRGRGAKEGAVSFKFGRSLSTNGSLFSPGVGKLPFSCYTARDKLKLC